MLLHESYIHKESRPHIMWSTWWPTKNCWCHKWISKENWKQVTEISSDSGDWGMSRTQQEHMEQQNVSLPLRSMQNWIEPIFTQRKLIYRQVRAAGFISLGFCAGGLFTRLQLSGTPGISSSVQEYTKKLSLSPLGLPQSISAQE